METDARVSWTKPQPGWTKLNVDGSCSSATGLAGCGGLLRDQAGNWMTGFQYRIGCCSPEVAEAWGILQGLRLASRMGVRNLIVECDSKHIIDLLRSSARGYGNVCNIMERCRTKANSFQQIVFLHVYREHNRIADFLAKKALCQPSGFNQLMEPPTDLIDLLYEDQIGASFYRRLPRNRSIVTV